MGERIGSIDFVVLGDSDGSFGFQHDQGVQVVGEDFGAEILLRGQPG